MEWGKKLKTIRERGGKRSSWIRGALFECRAGEQEVRRVVIVVIRVATFKIQFRHCAVHEVVVGFWLFG